MTTSRVAVVASHPIQYQAPWFRALARVVDLDVFFCHRQDAEGQAAAGFGQAFEWDVPLLEGYRSHWLVNRAASPSVDRFSGCDTPEIAGRLAEGRFEACIVNGWYLKSYLQTIRACRRLGIPVLSRGDSQLAGPRRAILRAAKYVPYRWLLGRIDAHLYVGAANREYLRHYGVDDARLYFAPHFVDTGWFRAEADAARADGRAQALRAELGLEADAAVLLFAGKLVSRKRPSDFIEAVASLRAGGIRVQGVVIGSGPLEGELRELARQRQAPIRFAGFRNQSAMPVGYAIGDLLVLPSDGSETWGLVINEAMACGVPAVVSDAAGASRDLADGRYTGRVFRCGDAGDLARAVRAMLNTMTADPDGVRRALLSLTERFSVGQAVAGTLDALAAVRAGRPDAVASA